MIERFKPIRRAEHGFAILCFALLAVTGFAQKFYETPWAGWVTQTCGGVDGIRRIHHFVGILTGLHVLLHLGAILCGVARRRLKLSLFPVPRDFHDFLQTWRYRFGFTREKPRYPLFSYQQKFQYFGLLIGGAVMILSGLILLFPHQAILIFPGHIIPAAREAHANDGLLAYVLLVSWHLYAAMLTPDSAPMNKSIFTGYITKTELKRRHLGLYEELFGRCR